MFWKSDPKLFLLEYFLMSKIRKFDLKVRKILAHFFPNSKIAPNLVALCAVQGCQMAYFQTQNPDLGQFWRVSNGKYWYIKCSVGLFNG
jgi:hypothetical protein